MRQWRFLAVGKDDGERVRLALGQPADHWNRAPPFAFVINSRWNPNLRYPDLASNHDSVKVIGTPCHEALVALLIERRERAGLRQADLAKRLGEYQSFIARIESGQRRIDVCEFVEIAQAIGFEPGRAISKILRDLRD